MPILIMTKYIIRDHIVAGLDEDVRRDFEYWRGVMYDRVDFNMADSEIHARAHCERVLLYALLLGKALMADDARGREALAIASVFHDTRRQDDYLDTGHGARAAAYYRRYCQANKDIPYLPEAAYAMRYHDLDDALGIKAIEHDLGEDAQRGLMVYRIFKDADALDRWRLGHNGLDERYLRTEAARNLVDFARRLVVETMDPDLLRQIEKLVDEAIVRTKGGNK